jgi:hypothetical protein
MISLIQRSNRRDLPIICCYMGSYKEIISKKFWRKRTLPTVFRMLKPIQKCIADLHIFLSLFLLIYFQRDATLHSLFLGNCSTCFGWYPHPSSVAHTTVFTVSGTCQTVTATCRYCGRVGTGLSVVWHLICFGAVKLLDRKWRYKTEGEVIIQEVKELDRKWSY